MSEYLGIEPLPFDPPKEETAEVCGKPGHNIITHCIEEPEHEGQHTYSPVPNDAVNMSDRLEEVMRMLTETCPNYRVGDFTMPKPKCCIFHRAAQTVMEAQEILKVMQQ